MNTEYFEKLFLFYKNVNKNKLYEWINVGHHPSIELLNYKENYEYLLNNLGTSIDINNLPIAASYKYKLVHI